MKRKWHLPLCSLLVGVLMAAWPTPAAAKVVTISWDVVSGATGYRLYQRQFTVSSSGPLTLTQSTDWTVLQDIPASTLTAGTTQVTVTMSVSDTAFLLLRVSAYNGAGEAIRAANGIWVYAPWDAPLAPTVLLTP